MVYSDAFAKKFQAPTEGVRPLDPGLQAVVVRVVQKPGDHPDCLLDLYLDDNLELAFPAGDEGLTGRADEDNPLFFVRTEEQLGAQALRWNLMLGSFHSVACRTGNGDCKVKQQTGPIAYVRHLVPGIAFQSYNLMCHAFQSDKGPVEMWILRSGHEQDTVDVRKADADKDATYRFAIPADLLEHVAGRIAQAVKYYDDTPLGPKPPRGLYTVPRRKPQ
jgi:hypothetical protein